jgi:hypothetical protein
MGAISDRAKPAVPRNGTPVWSKVALPLALVAVLVLWSTPVVYPLKVFVVFLHELSHGLAAIITGGEMGKITLAANQGGACYTRGGWRLLILPAGYLGSMLWGGLILVTAARTDWDKAISVFIGILVLAVTLLFVRSGFGLLYGLLFGAGMAWLGWKAPRAANDFMLKLIGLTSVLYAVLDIWSDLIARTVPSSDAAAMSGLLFGPPVLWGALWISIALAAAAFFLWWAAQPFSGTSGAISENASTGGISQKNADA